MVRFNDALPFQLAAAVGRVLSFALLAISLSACTTLRVGSDFEHSASFTEYHAFSLIPRERRGSENPLVVQRAHDAIQAALTEKGFVYVNDPATADFMVDFTIGSRERVDVSSYPSPSTVQTVDVRSMKSRMRECCAFDAVRVTATPRRVS